MRRAVERGHLGSLLLWGPPGSGKTSLARVLADAVGAQLVTISAVMSGVAEVRALVAEARDRLALDGRQTILFIDEIHRFNKAQQDALLPHVEDGTVTLVGATTENPYFEVNSALLSRLRVYRLEPLTDEQVAIVVRRALADAERGLAGDLGPAGGVALGGRGLRASRRPLRRRRPPGPQRPRGRGLDRRGGGCSRRRRAASRPGWPTSRRPPSSACPAYDRAGDGHYDTVSAFIKSIRGNDPDAALYWLAAMIAAGEDPRFIARRLIISASEDVGLADPRALEIAVAAAQALDWVGLPEAQYALAQATVYPGRRPPRATPPAGPTSPRWTTSWATGSLPVPAHLRSSGPGRRDYRYPHDFEGDDVDQQYLPGRAGRPPLLLPGRPGRREPGSASGSSGCARRGASRPRASARSRDSRRRIRWPPDPKGCAAARRACANWPTSSAGTPAGSDRPPYRTRLPGPPI